MTCTQVALEISPREFKSVKTGSFMLSSYEVLSCTVWSSDILRYLLLSAKALLKVHDIQADLSACWEHTL